MAAVVTTASTVTCGPSQTVPGIGPVHGGTVGTIGASKLKVAGSPVLVESGVQGQPVTKCQTPTITTTPTSSPCLHALSVLSPPSLSTKLQVGEKPVILATLQGTTDGEIAGVTPQALLSATVTQTLLTAI